jgi:Protein of unknown function (DUF2917)
MSLHNSLKLQQSALGGVLPECWKLVPDRAVTLRPDVAGVLLVSQGRVWVTSEGPHQGPANDWGDVVLRSGEALRLQPGQQVVVEAYGEAVNAPAFFSWEPAPAAPAAQRAVPVPWGDALARPQWLAAGSGTGWMAMVCKALAVAGDALSWLVQGRGRVLSPLETNQP